jgi:hypothetical protein
VGSCSGPSSCFSSQEKIRKDTSRQILTEEAAAREEARIKGTWV